MTKAVLDSTVLVDYLRGNDRARQLVNDLVEHEAELHGSYVVRTEILVGMRRGEEQRTEALLSLISWNEVGHEESDAAGRLGQQYLRSTRGISMSDLLVAELALRLGARLYTTNVKHFPMFAGLEAPYAR